MTASSNSNIVCNQLLTIACSELDKLRPGQLHTFPSACRAMMYSLPGNSNCVDCGAPRPQWASITYGALICVHCSGKHRSYGVNVSKVRSVDMDAWSHDQILAMLEGGNDQLHGFFERHQMGNSIQNITCKRYKTKAGLFYSTNLKQHVETVAASGSYKGRDATRRKTDECQTVASDRVQTPPSQSPTYGVGCQLPARTLEVVLKKKRSRNTLPTATAARFMQ
jgi:Putative GTPase activating protein for Arf